MTPRPPKTVQSCCMEHILGRGLGVFTFRAAAFLPSHPRFAEDPARGASLELNYILNPEPSFSSEADGGLRSSLSASRCHTSEYTN